MTDAEIEVIVNFFNNNVEIVPLSEEYSYQHLSLCVIDAVYSLGANYNATRQVPVRYYRHRNLIRIKQQNAIEETITEFINHFNEHGIEDMAQNVFQNKQRTSTRNGILKAEAVLRFANVLHQHQVEKYSEIPLIIENASFENNIRKIPGQTYGTALKYFFMLCGDDNLIKPDRMIKRFLGTPIERNPDTITSTEAQDACERIWARLENQNVRTIRHLDYLIWNFQRGHRPA